jgi:hypothetical protein
MTKFERAIRHAIATVNSEVLANPLAFLTESDIQSRLYAELLPSFGGVVEATNASCWGLEKPKKLRPAYSSRLHSELLLPEGRIDLAILDLRATWFRFSPKGKFSHVQLGASGDHAFLEIKVSRTHRSSLGGKSRWLYLLQADLNKLSRYPWLSFLLAYNFDIAGLSTTDIAGLRKSTGPNTRLIYTTAKLPVIFLDAELEPPLTPTPGS